MIELFTFCIPQTTLYISYTKLWFSEQNTLLAVLEDRSSSAHSEEVQRKELSTFGRFSVGFELISMWTWLQWPLISHI